MMKQLLPILFLLMTVCGETAGQGLYPLYTGNVWQYYEILPYYYGWTDRVVGDTTMQNGLTYRLLRGDGSRRQYLRQSGTQVFHYIQTAPNVYVERLLYDFSKTVGDTVIVRYTQNDTIITTVIQDGYVEVFGRPRRQWLYYERSKRFYNYVLRQLTDSIGLTSTEAEGSPSYRLTGAIINGVQFGTITGAKDPFPVAASRLALVRVFPNPFNPSTNVLFQVPGEQHVRLNVFNTLGQEIATLVDGVRSAGTYSASFDGANQPSGVYFCTLAAGNFAATRKLLLMK